MTNTPDFVPYGNHPHDMAGIEVDACQRLWSAVLGDFWDESFCTKGRAASLRVRSKKRGTLPYGVVATAREHDSALAWFGSRDFEMVCAFLGLDHEAVLNRWEMAQRKFNETGEKPCRVRTSGRPVDARPGLPKARKRR